MHHLKTPMPKAVRFDAMKETVTYVNTQVDTSSRVSQVPAQYQLWCYTEIYITLQQQKVQM